MSHEKHIVDRLSTRLPSLLPDWIEEEAPIFESFIQAYFEYLESEIIVLESQGELEGVRLEDGTSEKAQCFRNSAGILDTWIVQKNTINNNSYGKKHLLKRWIYFWSNKQFTCKDKSHNGIH